LQGFPLRVDEAEIVAHEADDPNDLSYSEWSGEDSIQKYLQSEDHQEIKRHNRNVEGARVTVKHYELVG
jgi:hypothetical protein